MADINRVLKQKIWDIISRTNLGYRFFLKRNYGGSNLKGNPSAPWNNSVLKTEKEYVLAVEQVRKLGLPVFNDLQKNWDTLAALDCILSETDKKANILDAGAELYSVMLPWLFLYGYRNLTGINLLFKDKKKRGPIIYEHGDITKTKYKDSSFDAITCLSVIEHGVNLREYFKEMSRILKPGGLLITSTDYYETPIETKSFKAFGTDVHIFNSGEVKAALDVAKEFNMNLTGSVDLESNEKVVSWKEFNLDYTFIIFTLKKSSDSYE